MEGWIELLDAAASPERPVVLALHPGTRAAMLAEGLVTGPDVRVIAPQGYRATLALQLHAAAVLTDSGGIQRESAWLDVPCLLLRSTTEWVEAVAGSRGRLRVIGLDRAAALDALSALAPISDAEASARTRAVQQVIAPATAARAIVATLKDSTRTDQRSLANIPSEQEP
jgi:UDP-N-acetylglucosamine 2-epimerase